MTALQLLQKAGFITVNTIADGHCLFDAIRKSCALQLPNFKHGQDMFFIIFKTMFESFMHIEEYLPFFNSNNPKQDFISSMQDYILFRHFDNQFCDIAPNIIANALDVTLNVIDVQQNGSLIFHEITPRSGFMKNKCLYVLKQSDHYKALDIDSQFTKSTYKEIKQPIYVNDTCQYAVSVSNPFDVLQCEDTNVAIAEEDEQHITVRREAKKNGNKNKKRVIPKDTSSLCDNNCDTMMSNHIETITSVHRQAQPKEKFRHKVIKRIGVVSQTNQVKNIVIGSSLVRGIGLELYKLGDGGSVCFTNPGCKIIDVAPRIKNMIPLNFCGTVSLLLGGNDCECTNAEKVTDNYEQLILDIMSFAPCAQILLCAIPPRGNSEYLCYKINTVNCNLHFFATFHANVHFLDNVLQESQNHFKTDNIHFTDAGRQLFAKTLNQMLGSVNFHRPLKRMCG